MDYRWIAQDADGLICYFKGEKPWTLGRMDCWVDNNPWFAVTDGNPNPNWRDSLIDLEKEDFAVVDGILIRKTRPEVKKGLTDTDLLDAIVKHELRVEAYACVVHVGTTYGVDVSNKKGDIRKAIKKWLKKNVDKKELTE